MDSKLPYQESPSLGNINANDTSMQKISEKPSLPHALPDNSESEYTVQSCLCMLGAFFSMFCSVGFVNAFGVFQEYYSQSLLQGNSESEISWLGSFNVFTMFAGALCVGALLEKVGPQTLLLAGSIITLLGLFLISLCKEYYQFFLAQGLLLSIGLALLLLPPMVTVPRYFVRGRGLALGIIIGGSSFGGIIWPIALRNLFVQIGFGWGVRITAFIMLPLLGLACLTVRLPPTIYTIATPKPNFKAIINPVLILLAIGIFFVYVGLFCPFFYITSWSRVQGLDANISFYMISIINASSLFSRIIPGILADRYGPYNVMIVAAFTSGLVCCCWVKTTALTGVVLFSLAYGFCSGGVISLQVACVVVAIKPQDYGVTIGYLMAFISIAGLIGPPINGQTLDKYGFIGLSVFSGVAELL